MIQVALGTQVAVRTLRLTFAGLEGPHHQRRRLAGRSRGHKLDWPVSQGSGCAIRLRGVRALIVRDHDNSSMLTPRRSGSFKQPILADDGSCIGVETVDGTKYHADKVVMAAGAWTPALIDLEDQCVSKVGRLHGTQAVFQTDRLGLGTGSYPAHSRRGCGLQGHSRCIRRRLRLLL